LASWSAKPQHADHPSKALEAMQESVPQAGWAPVECSALLRDTHHAHTGTSGSSQ